MLQNKKIDLNKWLVNSRFQKPDEISIKLITAEITKFNKEYGNDSNILYLISKIIYLFANDPWLKQKEVQSILNIDIKILKILNKIIRNSNYLQNLITKSGTANKYWQSISPFCSRLNSSINNKFQYPMRIAVYPGVSCMYYCGFCGRNQKEKYPLSSVKKLNINFLLLILTCLSLSMIDLYQDYKYLFLTWVPYP